MEALSYTTIDKSKWADGPWHSEPDKMQWTDAETGLPCLIVRADVTGALCGYVGVPDTHPGHGLSYDGTPDADFRKYHDEMRARLQASLATGDHEITREALESAPPSPEPDAMGQKIAALDCHGGLTFAGPCRDSDDPASGICHIPSPGEPDNVWWFGFDCAHFMDVSPGMDALKREMNIRLPMPPALAELLERSQLKEIYRDVPYVKAEVAALAKQLRAIV